MENIGINFYLRPKRYEYIDELNKKAIDSVNKIKKQYFNSIKELIESNKDIECYKDLLNLNKLKDVEDVFIFSGNNWTIDCPDIHICKLSYGWVPNFEVNNNFKSWDEFENFYLNNKEYFDIIDEYDTKINLVYFTQKCFEHLQNKDNFRSHLTETSQFFGINRWKDNIGFEWTNNNFS